MPGRDWGKTNTVWRLLRKVGGGAADPVPGALIHYKLDGTDSSLTRLGSDDFRIAPACPEAIGSQFNGTNQGNTANGDSSIFDGKQDEFTFTFWANSNIQTEAVVFLRSNFPTAGSNGFQITTKASGVVIFSSDTASESIFTINDGNWHFITVRYNSGSLFFGKDNVEESGIVRTNNTWSTPASPKVSIGTNQGIAAFYNGAIDDIRFYDRSLSADEITSLFNYTCDFNPSQLTTSTWYDAQDKTTITESVGAVSQWDDKGELGLNLTQGTAANQPTTAVSFINGLNALDFDADDYISSTSISASLSQAQLVVIGAFNADAVRLFQHLVRLDNSVSNDIFSIRENEAVGVLQGTGNSGGANVFTNSGTGLLYGTPFIGRQKYDGSNISTALNGVFGSSNTLTGTIDINEIFVSYTSNQMNGYIGEVVFIPSSDEALGEKIEGYLAWKWGLVASLPSGHPYKNSTPKFDTSLLLKDDSGEQLTTEEGENLFY